MTVPAPLARAGACSKGPEVPAAGELPEDVDAISPWPDYGSRSTFLHLGEAIGRGSFLSIVNSRSCLTCAEFGRSGKRNNRNLKCGLAKTVYGLRC